jgi:hypothetical protein
LAEGNIANLPATQTVLDYTKLLLTGEEIMFTVDVPYIPPQPDSIEMVQTAGAEAIQPEYLIKTCVEAANTSYGGGGEFSITLPLVGHVLAHEGRQASYEERLKMWKTVTLTQITDYAHGEVTLVDSSTPYDKFRYTPEPGFLGKDSAMFIGEFEGKLYKIQMNILVAKTFSDEAHTQSPCPPDEMIKIEESKSEIPAFDWSSVSIKGSDLIQGVRLVDLTPK